MKQETELLYESIANGNFAKSKFYLAKILEANTNKCDQGIKRRLLNKLNVIDSDILDIPFDIKSFIKVEYPSKTFNIERFVLSKEEEDVISKVINVWNVRENLSELQINYINSLLLYGKPGCGKTLLAKYIAYKLDLPFIYLNFSNLISSYLGQTGANIQKVFDYVSSIQCVFMLDEIDAIGLERGTDNLGELSRIVINLMQCLDTFNSNSIIIGATNRFDSLDNALHRRFSIAYEVMPPDKEMQIKVVQSYLDTIPNCKYTTEGIEAFLNSVEIKNYSNIINKLVNKIVSFLVSGTEISFE